MAGIPSTSMQGQQPPCMYSDPNVYIKNEYDQGEIYSVSKWGFRDWLYFYRLIIFRMSLFWPKKIEPKLYMEE